MKNKRILIRYGLLGGAILAVSFFISGLIFGTDPAQMDFNAGQILGYATMILALSTVFFGVKSYRDRERNGLISFKDAFMNGMIVVMIASILYVVGWMIYYPLFMPDFVDQYMQFQIKTFEEQGIAGSELESKMQQLNQFNDMYKRPVVMAGITFLEIFPVGVMVALICAFILKRTSFQENP